MVQSSALTNKLKENVRKYWDERSKTFDDDVGHGRTDQTESQLWQKNLTDIIGAEPKKILDVGTGTGMIAITLAELGHSITGIDLGEEMLKRAGEKAASKKLNISFLPGDAEEPAFEDNSFDGVICRHLLWTLPHPEKALQEWTRICKPGGLIIVIDGHAQPRNYFPDEKWDDTLCDRERFWREMYSPELVQILPYKENLTVDTITELFRKTGLSDVQSRYCEDISNYQKNLMNHDNLDEDHCEVQIIWGRVSERE
ncbi:MAG: methyltransferase domain-containing protein [Methanospirillum sp.]|uniref:class I SAM-dependent methyltransferase n=1 Tax=Methanospirillum sp. TaxID=45200 RepID=UPI002372C009|nr:class I SAM-dependent methyltransferase [Methanospirillum sp.]MDD1730414.1 methyltransferase domain-containing protein [Methanospirillum sp.]